MTIWFHNLNARERLVLTVGAAAVAVIVVWGLIWRPLHSNTIELSENVAEKSRLVVDLRRAQHLGGAAVPSGGAPATQSLVLLVDSSARPYGLAGTFTRTRPNGPDEINVSFQGAPFDVLVGWLVELERDHGIAVDSASFSEAREPGLVNGQLSLRRS